jgi:hypothetical protein
MRWFKKPAESERAVEVSGLVPEPLLVTFNKEIVSIKLTQLRESARESRGLTTGLQTFVEALQSKHEVFAAICKKGAAIDAADVRTLGGLVFTIRRKLGSMLQDSESVIVDGVRELVTSQVSIDQRLEGFADLASGDRKRRRGLWDLGAEILHFQDPVSVPLVTRWVWDVSTTTGALREFIRGNDTMRQIPIGEKVGAIEGARVWFHDALAEEGFYRDLPFVTDLVWAQAYSDYARSLSMSMGLVDAQFGARQDPLEMVVKILGIDSPEGRLKQPADTAKLH